jgi:hypothetical protein
MKPSLLLVLPCLVGLCAIGCGDAASASNEEEVASAAVRVALTRLDRVTPAEVAAVLAPRLNLELEKCAAAHPEIAQVNQTNLSKFYRVGDGPAVVFYSDLYGAIDSMLHEPGVTSVPVATLAGELEPWATRVLSRYADADGFFAPPFNVYERDARKAREEKAFSLAASPGGKSLREIRAQWAKVEEVQHTLEPFTFSSWQNPVKVAGDPDLGAVREAMRISADYEHGGSGFDAIDRFTSGMDQAGAREFEPIAAFLQSKAIKKHWLLSGRASGGSGTTFIDRHLVVLDERDQLWGMSIVSDL